MNKSFLLSLLSIVSLLLIGPSLPRQNTIQPLRSVEARDEIEPLEVTRISFRKEPKPIEKPDYFSFIVPFEGGHRGRVYDPNPNDGRPEPTIGVGHYMDRGDSRETFRKVFGDTVNWKDIYQGRTELTEAYGRRLFDYDVETFVQGARKRIHEFDGLPVPVQEGIVNALYRGDIGPKTIRLMNENRWEEATDEYLNHKGYRNATFRGMEGIVIRMNENARRFRAYAIELEEKK